MNNQDKEKAIQHIREYYEECYGEPAIVKDPTGALVWTDRYVEALEEMLANFMNKVTEEKGDYDE